LRVRLEDGFRLFGVAFDLLLCALVVVGLPLQMRSDRSVSAISHHLTRDCRLDAQNSGAIKCLSNKRYLPASHTILLQGINFGWSISWDNKYLDTCLLRLGVQAAQRHARQVDGAECVRAPDQCRVDVDTALATR